MIKQAPIICVILMLGALMTAPAFCQDIDQNVKTDENLRTFGGRVTSVDIGKSILEVSGPALNMTFAISPDTELHKDVFDIGLSDIGVGDYVVVGYVNDDKGPPKVLKVTVEYDAAADSED